MSKSGISSKSFGFTEPSVPKLISPSQAGQLYRHFAAVAEPCREPPKPAAAPQGREPAKAAPATHGEPATAAAANGGSGMEATLWQALHAHTSALKAALIASYVERNYLEAQVSIYRVPDCEPKPLVLEKPDCKPSLSERTFVGEDLARQLDAGGAALGERNGAFGVKSGRWGDLSREIDPGETLTFYVPNGARAAGGKVTVDKLFNDGPDPNRQEQGTIEVYDGDRLVKTIDIRGYSASNGQQTLDIDVSFTKLVFKAKGEYRGNGNHSDFAIRDVTILHSSEAPPIQPQPQPYPLPEPYIGIPRFAPDVIVGPIAPPAWPKDPMAVAIARSLGRLADLVDRSRLPEGVQNLLLDRIAALLDELRQAPRQGGTHRPTILIGVASLIQILDDHVPRRVSRRPDAGSKEHVMDHLKTMLFSVALGRGDTMDATSKLA